MNRIRGRILLALVRSLDEDERAIAQDEIAAAIRAHASIPDAARALSVSRATLYRITSGATARELPRRGPGRPRKVVDQANGKDLR